jgi:murein DD-endopeptidase MepM/ murein hydrolase activator NlpD
VPRGVRAGLAAFAVLVAATAPAAGQVGVSDPGQQSQAIDRQLSRFRQQYAEVSADAVDALARLSAARQAKEAADLELNRRELDLRDATAALTAAQQARNAAQQAAADAATKLVAARTAADAAFSALRVQALGAYIGQGRFGTLTATLKASNGEDKMAASYYATLAGDTQAGRVSTARAAREAAVAADSAAALTAAAAVSAEAAVRDRQAAVQQARDAQAAAQQRAADDVTQEEQLVATLQEQQGDYAAKLDALEAESKAIAATLRQQAAVTTAASGAAKPGPAKSSNPPTSRPAAPKTAAPPPAAAKPATTTKPAPPSSAAATSAVPTSAPAPAPASTFPQDYSLGNPPATGVALTYPLPGYPVVSRFGMRVDPVLNVKRAHEGIDIWAPEGTPIHSAGGGSVTWAGPRNGYGNAVFISHGNGVVTVYAHQSRVGVAVGQHVGTGDVIGYVGHTGLAAGPHLHFEVRVNGTAYDPLKFVSPR